MSNGWRETRDDAFVKVAYTKSVARLRFSSAN
jgi:hypothetical protein